jgi:cytochrome bd-type quinol oxidase subunit 1
MFCGKKTRLFWCGIFIIVFGAYLIIARVLGTIASYQSYQNYLNAVIHGAPLSATYNATAYLTTVVIWTIIFIAVYSVLMGIGVYVAKMGIKQPEEQTAVADQTLSA